VKWHVGNTSVERRYYVGASCGVVLANHEMWWRR